MESESRHRRPRRQNRDKDRLTRLGKTLPPPSGQILANDIDEQTHPMVLPSQPGSNLLRCDYRGLAVDHFHQLSHLLGRDLSLASIGLPDNSK